MALYHKHRPQRFSEIIGQDIIVSTILNEIARSRLAHAYLFSGPRGVGKTTMARVLAKAVNCEKRQADGNPCDACASCAEIAASRSLDVIEMDAASNTGVDDVREQIIENAQFQPTRSPYKIFIVDEAHMLSTSAFNALLKILEEPPERVMFILATTEIHKVPETIVSRCQRFIFKKIQSDVLRAHLQSILESESVAADDDVIDRIIRASEGCARDAVTLLDQLLSSGEPRLTRETAALLLPTSSFAHARTFVSALIAKDARAALRAIEESISGGEHLPNYANDCIEVMRAMLLIRCGVVENAIDIALGDDERRELARDAGKISDEEMIRLIDLLMKRKNEIKSSPLPQLPIELVVAEWCAGSEKQKNADNEKADASVNPSAQEIKKVTDAQTLPMQAKKEELAGETSFESKITRDAVNALWDEFIKKVESESASLSVILRMARVADVRENEIVLDVPYQFHYDALTKKTSLHRLESLLSELLHERARLAFRTVEKKETVNSADDLADIAATFGGELVH